MVTIYQRVNVACYAFLFNDYALAADHEHPLTAVTRVGEPNEPRVDGRQFGAVLGGGFGVAAAHTFDSSARLRRARNFLYDSAFVGVIILVASLISVLELSAASTHFTRRRRLL